jgi:hypothetical protein
MAIKSSDSISVSRVISSWITCSNYPSLGGHGISGRAALDASWEMRPRAATTTNLSALESAIRDHDDLLALLNDSSPARAGLPAPVDAVALA